MMDIYNTCNLSGVIIILLMHVLSLNRKTRLLKRVDHSLLSPAHTHTSHQTTCIPTTTTFHCHQLERELNTILENGNPFPNHHPINSKIPQINHPLF